MGVKAVLRYFAFAIALTQIDTGSARAQHKSTLLETNYNRVRYQPRHVHLSYDEIATNMVITWSTIDATNSSIVEFGVKTIGEQKTTGNSTQFQSPGPMNLTQYIHRVVLTYLQPGQLYIYNCGSDLGWSEIFYFQAIKEGTDWSPQLAVYGDLGNENAQSLPRLQREVQAQMYDAILHVGDMAYNMDEENGQVGDSFLEQLEPIAAYVPYMTCPGNHESFSNFLHYKKRFTMPGKFDSMAYSWNMGPIHFIAISTEFYYYLNYGMKPVAQQYEWLLADLTEAIKPENRQKRPWIIAFGHRPMYCSNSVGADCGGSIGRVRIGIPYVHWYGLEDMFMNFGVDLSIWAHEHSYERIWPIYDLKVYNGSYEEPYRNPKALVHVTTGSAGCYSKHDPFPSTKPDWSAFRTTDYGYSRLKVINRTHLYWEQVSDDQDGKVVDSFTLIRDNHEPYAIPPKKME